MLRPALVAATLAVWAVSAMAMSVEDFTLDKKTLIGQTIAITGSPACVAAELCYLYAPDQLAVSVAFDPSKLPREDRKTLLGCNPFTNICDATITGMISNGFVPMKASSITWQK
jgi:hypothetical protein